MIDEKEFKVNIHEAKNAAVQTLAVLTGSLEHDVLIELVRFASQMQFSEPNDFSHLTTISVRRIIELVKEDVAKNNKPKISKKSKASKKKATEDDAREEASVMLSFGTFHQAIKGADEIPGSIKGLVDNIDGILNEFYS